MGEGGIFKQLTQAFIERCLSAELDTHLAEEKVETANHSPQEGQVERPKNRCHGHRKKTIKGSASQFCKVALIPQPLLPGREKGSRIQSPSPALGEGFRVRATKVGCTH
jgi:hypothetical protein